MLSVITLYTINKIFTESTEAKLSSSARALYVNCLTHHFKDKKPTVVTAMAFDLFINDVNNYSKYERTFQELHKAGLVTIGMSSIRFENLWGKWIDRTKLDKVSPDEFVAGFAMEGPLKYKTDMLTHASLFELADMQHKASKKQVETMIEMFVKEQETVQKKYINFNDCVKHFINWMPKNLTKTQHENVKSGSKILGLPKK